MSLVTALATYLDTQGYGVYRPDSEYSEDEIGISIDDELTEPSILIVITQYAGQESLSLEKYDLPRIQIKVRGTLDPTVSRDLCQAIYDDWHGLGPLTVQSVDIQSFIGLNSGTIYLDKDDNGRYRHATNFEVTVRNPNRRGRSA